MGGMRKSQRRKTSEIVAQEASPGRKGRKELMGSPTVELRPEESEPQFDEQPSVLQKLQVELQFRLA